MREREKEHSITDGQDSSTHLIKALCRPREDFQTWTNYVFVSSFIHTVFAVARSERSVFIELEYHTIMGCLKCALLHLVI